MSQFDYKKQRWAKYYRWLGVLVLEFEFRQAFKTNGEIPALFKEKRSKTEKQLSPLHGATIASNLANVILN